MAIPHTVGDVTARARAFLNDRGGQIYSDTLLMPFVQEAVQWLYNQIAIYVPSTFRKSLVDVPYTPTVQPGQVEVLNGILPADMLLPVGLWFRQNPNTAYQRIDRVVELPTDYSTQAPLSPPAWSWQNRSLLMVAPSSPGLLRFDYIGMLPDPQGSSDLVFMDLAVDALAHRTAALAAASRGMVQQAALEMGRDDPPTGAQGFASQLIRLLVLHQQQIPRRMVRYSAGSLSEPLPRWENIV
jgi:hypothetical protein